MKPTFRRKGFSDMHAVNEESASTIVLAASTMPALGGGGRHNVKAICLSLHVRQNNESVCVWKVIWRWAVALLSERMGHHHGHCGVLSKRFYSTLRENTRRNWFFFRRIRWNKISLFWNFSFRTGYLEMRCSKSCYLRSFELVNLFDNIELV